MKDVRGHILLILGLVTVGSGHELPEEGQSLSQSTPTHHTLLPFGVGKRGLSTPASSRRFGGNVRDRTGRLEPYVKEGMRTQEQLSTSAELPQQMLHEGTTVTLDREGRSRAHPDPYVARQSLLQQRIKTQFLKAARRRFTLTQGQEERDEMSGIVSLPKGHNATLHDMDMTPEIQSMDSVQVQEGNENLMSQDSSPHPSQELRDGAAPSRSVPNTPASQPLGDMTEFHINGETQLNFDAGAVNSRESQTERFQSLIHSENSQTSHTSSLQSDLASSGEDQTHHFATTAGDGSRDSYDLQQEVSESGYSINSQSESHTLRHHEGDTMDQDKFLEIKRDFDLSVLQNENEDDSSQLQHLKLSGDEWNNRSVSGRNLGQNVNPRVRLQLGQQGGKRRLRFPLRRRMFRLRRPNLRNELLRRNSRLGRRRPNIRKNNAREARVGIVFPRMNFQHSDTRVDVSSPRTSPQAKEGHRISSRRRYSSESHQTANARIGVNDEHDEELPRSSGSISYDFKEDDVLVDAERDGGHRVTDQDTDLDQHRSHVNMEGMGRRLEEQTGEQEIISDSDNVGQRDQMEHSGLRQSSRNHNFSSDDLQKTSTLASSRTDQLTTQRPSVSSLRETESDLEFSFGEEGDTPDLPRNSWGQHFTDVSSESRTQRQQFNRLHHLSARQQKQRINRNPSERRKQNSNQKLLQRRKELQSQGLSQHSQQQTDIASLSQDQQRESDNQSLLQRERYEGDSQNLPEQHESQSHHHPSSRPQLNTAGGFLRHFPPQLGYDRQANPDQRNIPESDYVLESHFRPTQLRDAIDPEKTTEKNFPNLPQLGEGSSTFTRQSPQSFRTLDHDNTGSVPDNPSVGSSASEITHKQQKSRIQKLETPKGEERGLSASSLMSQDQSQIDRWHQDGSGFSIREGDHRQRSSSTLEQPATQDHDHAGLQRSSTYEPGRLTPEASVGYRDAGEPAAVSSTEDFDSSAETTTSHHARYDQQSQSSAGRREGFFGNNRQLFLNQFTENLHHRSSENQKPSGTLVSNTNRGVTSNTASSVQRTNVNNFGADVIDVEPKRSNQRINFPQSNFHSADTNINTGISQNFASSGNKEANDVADIHRLGFVGIGNGNESSYYAHPSDSEIKIVGQGPVITSDLSYASESRPVITSDLSYASESRPVSVGSTLALSHTRSGSYQDEQNLRQNFDSSDLGVSQGAEQESRNIASQLPYQRGSQQSNIRTGQVSAETRGEEISSNRYLGSTLVGDRVRSLTGQGLSLGRSQNSRYAGEGSVSRADYGSEIQAHQNARLRIHQVPGSSGGRTSQLDVRKNLREAAGHSDGNNRDEMNEEKRFDVWGSHLHQVRHNLSDNPTRPKYSDDDESLHQDNSSERRQHQRPHIKVIQRSGTQHSDVVRGLDDVEVVRNETFLHDAHGLPGDARLSLSKMKLTSEVSSPETSPSSSSSRGRTQAGRGSLLRELSGKPADSHRNYYLQGLSGRPTNSHGQPAFSFQRRPEVASTFVESFQQNDGDRFTDVAPGFRSSSRVSTSSISGPGSNSKRVSSSLYSPERTPGSQTIGVGGFAASAKWTKGNIPVELPESKFRQSEPAGEDQGHQVASLQGSYRSSRRRGTRKFVDTLSGVQHKNVKDGMLLRSLAAMLRGEDYLDHRTTNRDLHTPSSQSKLTHIPETGFRCAGRVPGYYADTHGEAVCRIFHFCGSNGSRISYRCPAGTVFNQKLLVCDHVFRVECSRSSNFYHVNEGLYGVDPGLPATDVPREFKNFKRSRQTFSSQSLTSAGPSDLR
ncbi:uncharacterized protein [Panulirus ornatus]|uniref:uncharacterized protein n=1 Tax=Panulirus ornatus TaxID=150431 RepID=UPI003A879AC3